MESSAVEVILNRSTPFGNETGTLASGKFIPGKVSSTSMRTRTELML